MSSFAWLCLTFVSLGCSIVGAWAQPRTDLGIGYSRWLPFYALALVCALVGQFLEPTALLALAATFVFAKSAASEKFTSVTRSIFFGLTLVLSLALALHLVPGFKNPLLVENVKFSPASAPFTQYANFDKASVGLFLLLFFCPRVSSVKELVQLLRSTALPATVLAVAVLALSLGAGFTRIDVKLPAFTLVFLATNLLFTCVAEEAFFRGLVQSKIAAALSKRRYGSAIAISASGLLFGLAHLAGGPLYTLFATLAGLGYAYIYAKTKRIEAAIATHFVVNALHFIFLTYPRVA